MLSIRNSAVAVALVVVAGAAVAAGPLVVRSSGPSAKLYPPGKSLSDGQSLALQPGDQLTLLDGRGTRMLRGPGTFPVSSTAASPATSAQVTAMIGGGSDKRVRIGAVRGLPPRVPSIWYIDVTRSGPACIADAASVTLWRARLDQDQVVTITGGKGVKVQTAWPSGIATLPWPAAVPTTAGADYALSMDGAAPIHIRLAVLAAKPGGLEDTAGALIREGCQKQLDLLADTFAVPADDPVPGGD